MESSEERRALDDLLSSLELILSEREALLGNDDLSAVPRKLANISDEGDALRYLAAVRDEFGTIWAEDAYQAWARLRGENPPQSADYRDARDRLERLGELIPLLGLIAQPTEGGCNVPGCRLAAAVEYSSPGHPTLKLCGPHHNVVRGIL